MDRNLALEVARATEAAALAVSRFIGKGDERAADRTACEAMRQALNSVAMDGQIVIGEGEEGETDLLYAGEIVGTGAGPEVEVALDALEGPLICATGGPNALSCIALSERGKLLRCPDTYMEKIACGAVGHGVIDLDRSPTDNLKALAEAKKVYVEDLRVAILDRPRHDNLIAEVRKAGAGIKLLSAGDLWPRLRPPAARAISTCCWAPAAPIRGCWPRPRSAPLAVTCSAASSRAIRRKPNSAWPRESWI